MFAFIYKTPISFIKNNKLNSEKYIYKVDDKLSIYIKTQRNKYIENIINHDNKYKKKFIMCK